jgi:hypothetical protein
MILVSIVADLTNYLASREPNEIPIVIYLIDELFAALKRGIRHVTSIIFDLRGERSW